jgi:hypothetical protein
MKLFADTGTCKIPAIVKYVKALLADELSGKVSSIYFKYTIYWHTETLMLSTQYQQTVVYAMDICSSERRWWLRLLPVFNVYKLCLTLRLRAAVDCILTAQQLLVFAHHKNVLDALEKNCVKGTKIGYIRIDGRTRPKVDTHVLQ